MTFPGRPTARSALSRIGSRSRPIARWSRCLLPRRRSSDRRYVAVGWTHDPSGARALAAAAAEAAARGVSLTVVPGPAPAGDAPGSPRPGEPTARRPAPGLGRRGPAASRDGGHCRLARIELGPDSDQPLCPRQPAGDRQPPLRRPVEHPGRDNRRRNTAASVRPCHADRRLTDNPGRTLPDRAASATRADPTGAGRSTVIGGSPPRSPVLRAPK